MTQAVDTLQKHVTELTAILRRMDPNHPAYESLRGRVIQATADLEAEKNR
jgi:hypothetical protein